MSRRLSFFLHSTLLVVLVMLSLGRSAVPAVRGHGGGGGGGHSGGGGHYGGGGGGAHYGGGWGGAHYGGGWGGAHYGGGWGGYGHGGYGCYRPYGGCGFYRPYYGFGAFGLGLGLGYGLGYGLGGYGYYTPYYGGYGPAVYPAGVVVANAVAANPAPVPTVAGDPPPPDNAAHLQLLVPEDAEVWFAGVKIERAGRIREFISPPLTPGRPFTYQIVVRYANTAGKAVEDKRDVQIHANDWFSIDFTRPPPVGKPSAGSRPLS